MIDADIGSRAELVLRFAIIFLGAVFMTLHTGNAIIAIWLAAFLVSNGWYSWRLARITAPVRRAEYLKLNALLVFSVCAYTSCAVYLFLQGTVPFKSIAIAALVAQSLFNLSRHRRGSLTAVFDTVLVTSAGLFIGYSSIMISDQSIPEIMIITACTTGVCSYYVIAQYRNVQLHKSLRHAREEAIQTQKMRAVGQITAGVSHDFNNLLTVIRGNIELAEIADTDEERALSLTDAKEAANRAADLTSQLLSFSRKARLEANPVHLDAFWSSFEKIARRTVPATIKLNIIAEPGIDQVFCDLRQLEIALLNLTINARDALEGKGEITLRSRVATDQEIQIITRQDLRQPAYGAIEICDNGTGIDPDILPSITEPFFTTKPVGEGSGLGLSMVKGFTEQSGGGLSITSDLSGTQVVMILPRDP